MQDAFGSGDMSALKNPIGVTDDSGKQPRAGECIGDQGPAETLGELEQKRGEGLFGEREASDEYDAVGGIEKGRGKVEGGFGRFQAARFWQRKILGLAIRQDGLGKRHIQVNGAGIFAYGGGGEVFQNSGELGAISGTGQVNGSSHERAKDSGLVDRLVCAGAAKFRRAVGGDENQRDIRVEGFDAGGEEVCHGGTAGGDANCRTACGHGPAESGE